MELQYSRQDARTTRGGKLQRLTGLKIAILAKSRPTELVVKSLQGLTTVAVIQYQKGFAESWSVVKAGQSQ